MYVHISSIQNILYNLHKFFMYYHIFILFREFIEFWIFFQYLFIFDGANILLTSANLIFFLRKPNKWQWNLFVLPFVGKYAEKNWENWNKQYAENYWLRASQHTPFLIININTQYLHKAINMYVCISVLTKFFIFLNTQSQESFVNNYKIRTEYSHTNYIRPEPKRSLLS